MKLGIKKYKDMLYKIRELLDIMSTAGAVSTAVMVVLQIAKIMTLSSTLLPIPIIAGCIYIALKFIPIGIKTIKKQLLKRDIESLTEEEKKELEDLKSIIDEKCTTIRNNTPRTTVSEPITTNTLPSVYEDNEGREYIRNRRY
jgi:ABC-type bacteriocin/lantibiotic exporter with double-glycine peptidase domain